jgi:hypothetical protein
MLRIILGVIVGFIVWSIVWVGTDAVLTALFPEAYGKYITELQTAEKLGNSFETKTSMNFFALTLSLICSVISGFVAALIAKESTKSTLLLGVVLLAVGLLVQISFWGYFPLWYHLTFLLMLIPATVLGGKLRKV